MGAKERLTRLEKRVKVWRVRRLEDLSNEELIELYFFVSSPEFQDQEPSLDGLSSGLRTWWQENLGEGPGHEPKFDTDQGG